MIRNSLELSKVLSEQAENSGFARAAIVIIMGHDGEIHKTEFGFNKRTDVAEPLPVIPFEKDKPDTGQDNDKSGEDGAGATAD